jgi:hypothetical protein
MKRLSFILAAALGLSSIAVGATGDIPSALAHPRPPTKVLIGDELPRNTPLDGASTNGILFSNTPEWSIDWAVYNSGPRFPYVNLQEPYCIFGYCHATQGNVTMTFDVPTTVVEFDLGTLTTVQNDHAAVVTLVSPSGKIVQVTELSISPLAMFSEGHFSYSGRAVKQVVVEIPHALNWVMDNIEFFAPPGR